MGNDCNKQSPSTDRHEPEVKQECEGANHVSAVFECQDPNCYLKRLICSNCADRSSENPSLSVCRLCRTAEYMRNLDVDSIKVDTSHNIKLVSCVSYDK